MNVDCLVAGDGIAGLSTAINIARTTDLSVALASVPTYTDKIKVGEVVPPDFKLELSALGVWSLFQSHPHVVSPGVTSWWGSEQSHDTDFIYTPHGSGWNIDRAAFEKMLQTAAASMGIPTHRLNTLKDIYLSNDNCWAISNSPLVASFLVNATGRSNHLSRFTGKRKVLDKLVAYAQYLDVSGSPKHWDARLWIESTQNGWWYSALLPADKAVVVFLSDSDINDGSATSIFNHNLSLTSATKERTSKCTPVTAVCACAANTSKVEFRYSSPALTVGDASFTSDPLRGKGIMQCLQQARTASNCIAAHFDGAVSISESYTPYLENEFDQYFNGRSEIYSSENRWAHHPFWKRRATPR